MKKTRIIIPVLFSLTFFGADLFSQTQELQTHLSIKHLVQYPASYLPGDTTKRYPLLFALHGHGSNEVDLINLAPHFQKNLLWISGRGPLAYGQKGFDWYLFDKPGNPDPAEIAKILRTINTFIAELKENYPVDPDKIFLMGFSMGSIVSMSYLMAYPQTITGVIAQSGYLPADIGMETDLLGTPGTSAIITHGTEDSMIPVAQGQRCRDVLTKLGVEVTYREFPMAHSISGESISAVRTWLESKL